MHFDKAHREWRANLRLTAGQHFPRANAVDSTSVQNHQAETVDALTNLATATSEDRATVATLTDTIAQLLSELALAQAKLISSLLDNQRLLKSLSDKRGKLEHFRGCDRRKDFWGWCGRTMGWSEHPILSHPWAQVSPPQFQVS